MLTVLSIAYPLASVGPDAVGGAEQVLAAIDRALVAAGHRSLVVACEGSKVAGMLLPVPAPPAGDIGGAEREAAHEAVRSAVESVIGRADVVHLHGVDFYEYLPPPGTPALVTLHLPPDWYPSSALHPSRVWPECCRCIGSGRSCCRWALGSAINFDVRLASDAPADAPDRLLATTLATSDAARCDLPELPEGARLHDTTTPSGWMSEAWTGPPCPVLRLKPEPAVPNGMRRDLRQARNRAGRTWPALHGYARAASRGR